MNYILQNGVSSKNTISNTEKAISLALADERVSGVSLNLYMTRDYKIVISSQDTIENLPNVKISDYTLDELLVHNIGNRVNRESILTLEEALNYFCKNSKEFVFTLEDHGTNNKKFVEVVASIINLYPNCHICVKSSVAENVLYLKELVKSAKVGAIILDKNPYFWKKKLDFYCLDNFELLSYYAEDYINQTSNKKYSLMVEDISDEEEALSAIQELKKRLGCLSMIVSSWPDLNELYTPCQKMVEELEGIK